MAFWYPMSIVRTPRSFFNDPFAFDFDQQMRSVNRDIDRMFAHVNRLMPFNTIDREGPFASLPLAMREAEDAMALNPISKDKDGKPQMQMNLDVRAFKPEEISIKTKEGKYLEVQAKHEESTDNGRILRHYHRMFTLPEGVRHQEMTSQLSADGVLSITAPVDSPKPIEEKKEEPKAVEGPKPMPITHE